MKRHLFHFMLGKQQHVIDESITRRQFITRTPIADLNAEVRKRRRLRLKRIGINVAIFIIAVVIGFGLALLCGKGSRVR